MGLQADFHVDADSEWGIERALDMAVQHVTKGEKEGQATHPKYGILVKWRVMAVTEPTEVPEFDAGGVEPPPPAGPELPDVSAMDIEDAKGIIGTSRNRDELVRFRGIEEASPRYPGGRKGVLRFIKSLEAELDRVDEKKKKEAEAAAKVAAKTGEGDGPSGLTIMPNEGVE